MSIYLAVGREKRLERKAKHLKQMREGAPAAISRKAAPQQGQASASTPAASVVHTTPQSLRKKRDLASKGSPFLVSLALHLVAAFIATFYIVQQAVLDDQLVQVDMVNAPLKQQIKRRSRPRVAQRPDAPKPMPTPKPQLHQPITTDARIPVGAARFTLPASELPTAILAAPSAGASARNLLMGGREAEIASVLPQFNAPKLVNSSLMGKIDGNNISQVDFTPDAIEPIVAGLGDVRTSFADFLKTIREKIKRAQRYPPAVREATEGTTRVRFSIRRDGHLVDAQVTASSGSSSLDAAAVAAIRNAAPFPPFPEDQAGETLRIEVPIVFQLRTN